MAHRWSWSTRQARRDLPQPLGGSDPAAHLTGAPEWDGGRTRPAPSRMPATPGRLLDAGVGFVGVSGPARPLGTDGDAAERSRGQAPDRTSDTGVSSAGLHGQDAGDGAARLIRAGKGSDGVQRTTELRILEPEIASGSRLATLRGRNSLPENNPDGYRFGARVFRWTERKMYKPRIVHTARPAPIQTAKMPNVSPPIADAGRGTSPYSWNTRGRVRTFGAAPLVRRQPPAADYATLGDDPTPAPASAQFVRL